MKGSTLALVLCAALVAALAMPAPSHAHAGSASEFYKVLTYNVAGMDIPLVKDGEAPFAELSLDERAKHIGKMILDGGYDIVALNEVWNNPLSGSMRDELVAMLSASYPHRVELLEGSEIGDVLDSGLMLFTKFPIVSVPLPSGQECYDPAETLAGSCTVAFHEFESEAGEDALAGKGVGFVRVQNPATGGETNVFFTHMQADPEECLLDGPDCGPPARAKQVAETIEFVDAWAPAGEARRDTLLMGDLNIRFSDDNGAQTTEYKSLVADPGAGLASIGLADAWLQHAATDLLPTSVANPWKKYDYILHRAPPTAATAPTTMCIQHQTLEKHFRIETGDVSVQASDHHGYAALIGAAGPRCSPSLALIDPPNGATAGAITHPGSYQWYRFTTGGTYTFAVTAPVTMELAFYADKDLSVPLKPLEGTGVIPASSRGAETVIVDPNTPFYVRVRPLAPLFTGAYVLKLVKHDGSSPAKAIHLDPFMAEIGEQMGPQAVNPLSQVWYRFRTHTLHSGQQQWLKFVTRDHPGLWLRFRIFDKAAFVGGQQNPLAVSLWNSPTNVFPLPDPNIPQSTSPIPAKGADYYLVVERTANSQPSNFEVEWQTNLFFVDLILLEIVDMDDDPEPTEFDEPEPVIGVDGPSFDVPLGSLDEEGKNGFPAWLRPVAVGTALGLHMYENQGAPSCLQSPVDCDDLGYAEIGTAAGGVHDVQDDCEFSPDSCRFVFTNAADDDAEYHVYYNAWRIVDD